MVSARIVAHVLFRHRRKMAAMLVASLGAGAALAVLTPVEWRAEAALMVEGARPEPAHALAALLGSRDLHDSVVGRHGERLFPVLAERDRVAAFAADLSIAADGPVVRVSLDGADPAATAAALTALIDEMRVRNQAVFAPVAPADGAAAQEEAVQEEAAARAALAAFRRQFGVFDAAAERESLLKRRSQVEAETAAAEAEAQAGGDRLAVLKARLADTPATIALATENERSKVAEDARGKLFELEAREAELLGRYQDSSAFVQNLRAEKRKVETMLGELQNATQSRVTNGTNPVHQELEKEANRAEAALSSARAKAKAGQRQLAELDRRLEAWGGTARRLAELEAALTRAEARSGGGKPHGPAIDGIGIVQQASVAARPLRPGRLDIMAAAGLTGLVLALLAAVLGQRLSSRFATPAEIERRLGLPVLTSIPRES
jgi:uncharacterized protein involved in exopolysaccharide biosynthesis